MKQVSAQTEAWGMHAVPLGEAVVGCAVMQARVEKERLGLVSAQTETEAWGTQVVPLRQAVVGWLLHSRLCFLSLSWAGFKASEEEFWGEKDRWQ